MHSVCNPRRPDGLFLAGVLLAFVAAAQARMEDPGAAQPAAPVAQRSSADIAWADLEKARPLFPSREAHEAYLKLSPVDAMKFEDTHGRRVVAMAEVFWNQYPDDPRRLKALQFFLGADPLFIKSFPPTSKRQLSWSDLTADLEADLAWQRKGWQMAQSALSDPDISRAEKEEVEFALFACDFRRAQRYFMRNERYYATEAAAVEFWQPFRQRFDAHVIKYADSEKLVERARDYLGALPQAIDEAVPGAAAAAEAGWRHLQDSMETDAQGLLAQRAGVKALRAAAAAQVRALGVIAGTEPIEMKFTAIDGRQVDVSLLRGKVVLIDFWATWCAPCVVEMPIVKAVYEKYREEGFEVIGISFDDQKELEKVKQFIARHGISWPQGINGTLEDNYTALYDVPSVPYVFLLDRNGKIVNRDDRGRIVNRVAYGEQLEPIVRRYLGLEKTE